jgi:ATP-binding cassette subfamily C exporter for protease/lipase/ATP-binding cassette subfamily C protein EexD
MLISKSVAPIQKLVANWKDLVAAKQSYERLNALLEEDTKREMQMQLPSVMGSLDVSKASAVPPGHNKPVLLDIDFKARPGQAIAIVGPSAAGKTCLARLLVGIWKPARGSVRLDAVELSDWNPDEFGPQIGYVPQDIYLVDDTIASNIAFGENLKDVNQQAVETASKIANLHDFIMAELPQQYQTIVGERGIRLSGGQRQRIGIARALYHNPQILILDEATSALDNQTEKAVMDAVNNIGKNITIIIIAHRLSTIKNCDLIFLLDNGELKDKGTFEELMKVNEQFRKNAKYV